jgi:hypothetical protein
MRFIPLIHHFTDGSTIAMGLTLLLMYDAEYVKFPAWQLGFAIQKFLSDKAISEPDAAMEFLLTSWAVSRSHPVLAMVPALTTFVLE